MITVSFAYNNHRGVTEARTVDVYSLDFLIKPGFGYQPGWFLHGFCHDRKAMRSFALSHIVLTPEHAEPINVGIRIIIDRLAHEAEQLKSKEQHNEDQRNSSDAIEAGWEPDSLGDDQ